MQGRLLLGIGKIEVISPGAFGVLPSKVCTELRSIFVSMTITKEGRTEIDTLKSHTHERTCTCTPYVQFYTCTLRISMKEHNYLY